MAEFSLIFLIVFPLMGAVIGSLLGLKNENYRNVFNVIMTGIELLIVVLLFGSVQEGAILLSIPNVMGTGLQLKLDMFRYVFLFLTVFIWFLTTLYSAQYLIKYHHRNRYYGFFMVTLGCTVGIFLSENILNLFTFFEIMSFTSYALVIHDEDAYSHKAGISYLSMSVAGGLVLLMGIFILYDFSGTLLISEMADHIHDMGMFKYIISALIIGGFGVKASLFPLHVWVPKAYSAAPTPASAVLAGVLKKTGVFGIMIMTMVIFKGDLLVSSVLVVLGFMNILVGGFFAIFQRNVKRILAYSSMSQAGYIFVGIGLAGLLKEHGAVAVMGTLFHIVNHGLFKVLLFLGAGLIYMLLNDLSINKIKGFGRYKSKLKFIFLIGICGIVGMPGFNGYISKTLLHEALAEAHHMYHTDWFIVAEVLFTLGSALTAAYMCKLFVAVFVEKNKAFYGQYKDLIRKRAMVPLFVLSGGIILIGIKPEFFVNVFEMALGNLGYEGHVSIEFFAMKPMGTAMGTILLGIGIYAVFVRKMLYRVVEGKRIYVNPSLSWFQLEEHLYRPVVLAVFKVSSAVFKKIDRIVINFVEGTNNFVNGVAAWDGGNFKDFKLFENIRIVKFDKARSYNRVVDKTRAVKNHLIEDNMQRHKEEYVTLKSLIKKAHTDASGITYSIYLLALVLVATIGFMFIVNGI